jgi:pimeloyl-ACP methyl ester carboxylesterase
MGKDRSEIDCLLLHGAWCGPWIWDAVARELRARGMSVLCPELPNRTADAGVARYLDAVAGQLRGRSVRAAVGHSLAGILLEPLAARCEVARLIYLCAFVPAPGISLRAQWRAEPELLRPGWERAVAVDGRGRSFWSDLDVAAGVLFGDCAVGGRPAAAKLAPQGWALARDRFQGRLTSPSAAIIADDDRLLDPTGLRSVARRIPDAALVRIAGGHMPMICRPQTLARLIAEHVAEQPPRGAPPDQVNPG